MTDRIVKIDFEGFRSCRNTVLDELGDVTVLVGRNGVGKSNILKAIRSVSLIPSQGFSGREPSRAELEFLIDGERYQYSFSVTQRQKVRKDSARERPSTLKEAVKHFGDNGWQTLLETDGGTLHIASLTGESQRFHIGIASGASCLQVVSAIFGEGFPEVETVIKVVRFLNGVRYFPLDEVSEPSAPSDKDLLISEKVYNQWLLANDKPDVKLESVCLQILHLHKTDKNAFDELLSLLGGDGVGLIKDINVLPIELPSDAGKETTETNFHISFQMHASCGGASDGMYQFSDLSVGTRRIIRILLSVVSGGVSVALLEHPEDAVHAGMVRKLMHILRDNSNRRQLIIASHSPQVFNVMSPDQIRFVSMESGSTAARSLSPTELQAAANFICNEGSLSEFIESIED